MRFAHVRYVLSLIINLLVRNLIRAAVQLSKLSLWIYPYSPPPGHDEPTIERHAWKHEDRHGWRRTG